MRAHGSPRKKDANHGIRLIAALVPSFGGVHDHERFLSLSVHDGYQHRVL